MTVTLAVGILGPLEVRVQGEPVGLGGPRQRALLAVLALSANQVVSRDRLIDELWGSAPPATARHTLQVFVSRLRTALGPAAKRLVTRPPGYVLLLDDDELDADVFERLVEGARAELLTTDVEGAGTELLTADVDAAARRLRQAMSLWRGPPLDDFTYEPFAQAAIARLEELRLTCREELIDAELALGLHVKVAAELEALVRQQPYRERPRGQLMLALYRSGRQADALDVFRDARRALLAELAVEPSNALRELEQRILRQDPALTLPLAAPATLDAEEASAGGEATAETDGRALPVEPAAAATVPVARKDATILVVKLSGARDGDPEIVKGAVAAIREEAETIVRRHGGVPVFAMAGEVMSIFGVPVTKEDDPLRAVRAAHEIRGVRDIGGGASGQGLAVALAIASGEIVAEGTSDLFGEPLERALRMVRASGHGEVLLDDSTRRSTASTVDTASALDGTAWRLVGLTDDRGRGAGASPMVGRDRELQLALDTFHRAVRSREAHLLTVIGDAGLGKSRLAQELSERVAGEATVLTGHCLSYGDGIAFWPWREALAQAAGEESQEAVRALVGDAPDAEAVTAIISTTLRLAAGESVSEQVPWAFRRLLEVMTARRPVLLVIEDVHWAEAPLLELIDYLVDWLRAPVLVLALARPDLLDVRPTWGGGRSRVSSVVLGPLDDDAAHALLEHQLGGADLARTRRAEILRAAEGNPLFVEQLLLAQAEDPSWDRGRRIPATIQSLLAARLDQLGVGERAVIERAAVIGREFWPGAVTELLPPEAKALVAPHLGSLVHRGLIHPEASILAGQEQLGFHHILIRDVAYGASPKALRASLHEQFADWLIVHGSGFDEFVGYHYEQAFGYRHEFDPHDERLAVLASRGGEFLTSAGRRALSRGDANAAVKLLRSSADLVAASGRRRPDVLLDLGAALTETDVPRAGAPLIGAYEQARAEGDEALAARALIELSYRRAVIDRSVPVVDMLSVAEDAVKVFTRVGDEGGIARAWHNVAMVHWLHSQCADMETVLERALVHAERAGDARMQARALGFLARATVAGPRHVDDGLRRCDAILARVGEDVDLLAVTETMMSVLEAMQGRFEDARTRWQGAKRRLEAVGLSVTVAKLQMYQAFVELLAGTPRRAEPELAAACSVLEHSGERGHLAATAGLMARVLWADGRYRECERYCRMSEEAATADDVVSEILWRGTGAKLLAVSGRAAEARELVGRAITLAEGTDFLLLHASTVGDRAEVEIRLGGDGSADIRAAAELMRRKGIRVELELQR